MHLVLLLRYSSSTAQNVIGPLSRWRQPDSAVGRARGGGGLRPRTRLRKSKRVSAKPTNWTLLIRAVRWNLALGVHCPEPGRRRCLHSLMAPPRVLLH